MDLLTITGALIGLITIVLGQFLESGHLIALCNIPALIIVLGGTLWCRDDRNSMEDFFALY